MIIIDPDAHGSPFGGLVAGWERLANRPPHFASVVFSGARQGLATGSLRLSQVSDEHDPTAHTDRIDDQIEDVQAAMSEARHRLAEVPAEVVVTNHVMGLYELAAIHLSSSPPNLVAASLAIDAVGHLVEGLGDRLGADAGTMRDALANIRMAFVSVKHSVG
jgi:uncharacterized protein with GYD domain